MKLNKFTLGIALAFAMVSASANAITASEQADIDNLSEQLLSADSTATADLVAELVAKYPELANEIVAAAVSVKPSEALSIVTAATKEVSAAVADGKLTAQQATSLTDSISSTVANNPNVSVTSDELANAVSAGQTEGSQEQAQQLVQELANTLADGGQIEGTDDTATAAGTDNAPDTGTDTGNTVAGGNDNRGSNIGVSQS